MRRDYFVRDEFGDIWNEEPLPTFHQAYIHRGYVSYGLNSVRTLTIFSVERGTDVRERESIPTRADRHYEALQRAHREFFAEYAPESDF